MDKITEERVEQALKAIGDAIQLIYKADEILRRYTDVIEYQFNVGWNNEAIESIARMAREKDPEGAKRLDDFMARFSKE